MLNIEPAQYTDSKLILKYIKDLAAVEKFPFHVSVTQSDIENNLFGEESVAKALIFYEEGSPCGFCIYYYTFSSTTGRRGLHLDDLYIEPEYQGKGIGKKALSYLAKIAKEKGCPRFEWWALKTNDSAVRFYLDLGAKRLEEISVFRLDESQINQMAEDS